jgi:hypothetical protein
MRRTIEISASFTGVIPTGSYENEKPYYSVKETVELDQEVMNDLDDTYISNRQKQLAEMCRDQFKRQAEVSYTERIAKEYRNIRFYDGKDGLKYPSVTSIIGWDKDFFMSPEELQQHASRGSIIDKQVEIFLTTNEWKEPKDIPEIYPDLVIVKKGSLGLDTNNVDFQAFYKKYPFKVIDQQQTVINHEHRYGGRREILCVIESSNKGGWEKVEGCLFDVPTLLDVKATTALDKVYVMKQNTAYAKCDNVVQQIGAIHLKKDNEQGYAKPIIETNLNKYWSLFLADREKFQTRYGI